MVAPKKYLGQHWLRDKASLKAIADSAELTAEDIVLEIGPGQGALTAELLRRAKEVIAVEIDQDLADKLPEQFPGTNLHVIRDDILEFDLRSLPEGYKVVGNIPYYITGKIVRRLFETPCRPKIAVLLVQKEVAERLAGKPGDMSLLSINAQIYAEVYLGEVIPARLFVPPPKVDSQVVVLKSRLRPLVSQEYEKLFWRLVKAGFSAKRKKLRSSLAGGLNMQKTEVDCLLAKASIDSSIRAEDLSIANWLEIAKIYKT